jgi:hypothetical protein
LFDVATKSATSESDSPKEYRLALGSLRHGLEQHSAAHVADPSR